MKPLNIFISYRRADLSANGMVQPLHDRLAQRYGAKHVFADVHTLRPGTDFRQTIQDRIRSCDVLLVLIGAQWLKLLKEREGREEDFVRTEIEAALARELEAPVGTAEQRRERPMRVVPVLIDDAKMPSKSELPPDISALADKDAWTLATGRHFEHQLTPLLRELDGQNRPWLKIAGGVAAAATMIAAGVSWLGLPAAQVPQKPVTVLTVMGENVHYERVIERAFSEHLKAELEAQGIKLEYPIPIIPRFTGSYASPDSPSGKQTWEQVISGIRKQYPRHSVDYIACLGTYACTAIRDARLVAELEAKGVVFLGVTDPYRAKLANAYKMSGVRYGSGGSDWARIIRELFDEGQRLVYIYGSGFVQDEYIAADIRNLNSKSESQNDHGHKRDIEIHKVDGDVSVDLLDKVGANNTTAAPIYFSWYGLDNMLAVENDSILSDNNIWYIPSTYSGRNLNNAGIVVSVQDGEVGRLGAELILRDLKRPVSDLESEPVAIAPFHVWLKRDVIERKGMKLRPEIYKRRSDPMFIFE